MNTELKNKRVAILATDCFEQSELEEPLKVLEEAEFHEGIHAKMAA